MAIQFCCPAGHPLSAREGHAGSVIHCAECGEPAIVPGPPPPPAADEAIAQTFPEPVTYRPDAGHIDSVRWLALILGLIVAFSLLPVLRVTGLSLETAPGWARAVMLLAALQAIYLLWMLAVPDFSSVWVVMLVFAGASTVYALATSMSLAAPPDKPLPLSLGDVRETAGTWSAAVLALNALGTYLAGRLSTRWRRAVEIWHVPTKA